MEKYTGISKDQVLIWSKQIFQHFDFLLKSWLTSTLKIFSIPPETKGTKLVIISNFKWLQY